MSSDHYDPSCDLSVQDIVVNSITNMQSQHTPSPHRRTNLGRDTCHHQQDRVPHLPSLGHADIPGGEGFKPDLYFAKIGQLLFGISR